MSGPRKRARFATTAVTGAVMVAAFSLTVAPAASGFGTLNIFGQSAEHEKITRSLASAGFQGAGLDLLAGTSGRLGGAGAPDDITKGLSPGAQHCDGTGYLPGKKGSQAEADAAMRDCLRWFQWNMTEAVDAAGLLVDASLASNPEQSRASFSTCAWPKMPGADKTALCTVYNRLGRALHLAQDFYAHTNWSDYSTGNTLDSPPGLDRVNEVPAGLRFPQDPASVALEPGIINGCDNTFGDMCIGRVKHDNSFFTRSDGINKDWGIVNADNCWASVDKGHSVRSSKTDPEGRTNFARAICSAINQTAVTWGDFQQQVLSTYGADRGALIIQTVQAATPPMVVTVPELADEPIDGGPDVVAPSSGPFSDDLVSADSEGTGTALGLSGDPVQAAAAGDDSAGSPGTIAALGAVILVILVGLGVWFARSRRSSDQPGA